MRVVFGLVLLLGLGLAGFAVYMAKNYIQAYQTALAQERSGRAPAIETADVYVAKRPLKYGEHLTPEDVHRVAFPTVSLPEGVFRSEEALFPRGKDELRAVLRAMETGEAVLTVKVTKPGEDAGITNKLTRGMRAFAIRVDSTSGVSGFLRPGDHVDIYWTGNIGRGDLRTEGDSTGDVTKLIETGVRLIAVDQSSDANRTEARVARTVTVAVYPRQVAALAQAQSTGRLSLSLVGVEDDTVAELIEIDQNELLGLAATPRAAPAPKAKVCTVRTRRGGDVVEAPIPCTN